MKTAQLSGWLIRFSGPRDPDLTGEFFTDRTDYGLCDGDPVPVVFGHGLDAVLDARRIGRGVLRFGAKGIHINATLDITDDYVAAVADLAASGLLGWSSGAASHLVRKQERPDGTRQILSWPIAEASLTTTPAEPRNLARAVKAVQEAGDELALQTENLRLRHESNRRRWAALGVPDLARDARRLVAETERARHEYLAGRARQLRRAR